MFFLFFFFNDTATTEIYTLSLHDALPIWCGRTARHIHVHRDEPIDPLHDAVAIVDVAGGRARPHRDHIARLRHLIVDLADHRRHPHTHRAGYDHEVGLPRRRAKDAGAVPVDVVARGDRGDHFDGAAGEAEGHRPERPFAGPVDGLLQRGQDDP